MSVHSIDFSVRIGDLLSKDADQLTEEERIICTFITENLAEQEIQASLEQNVKLFEVLDAAIGSFVAQHQQEAEQSASMSAEESKLDADELEVESEIEKSGEEKCDAFIASLTNAVMEADALTLEELSQELRTMVKDRHAAVQDVHEVGHSPNTPQVNSPNVGIERG